MIIFFVGGGLCLSYLKGGGALLIQAFKYSNLNIINYLIKWKEN